MAQFVRVIGADLVGPFLTCRRFVRGLADGAAIYLDFSLCCGGPGWPGWFPPAEPVHFAGSFAPFRGNAPIRLHSGAVTILIIG